jgi:hypothetical protein
MITFFFVSPSGFGVSTIGHRWKKYLEMVPSVGTNFTRSTALHAIEIFPDPESRRQVNIALRQFRNSGFSIFFDIVYLVNPRYD